MTTSRALGDYNERTIVDAFDPRIADIEPTKSKYGLNLQVQYFYGGLRDEDRRLYVLERKFIGPMTSGLWLMTNRDAEHIKLAPQALRTARGEIRRHIGPDSHRYADALMAKVGADLVPEGEQSLELTLTDRGVTWVEGELLQLEATPFGCGLMHYSPMPESSLLYTMQANRASGTIMGRPVTGFVLIDHGYWPHGTEWKEFRFFAHSQVAWNVFANEYDDGSVEAGFFIDGLGGFAVSGVFDEKGPVSSSSELGVAMTLGADDWVERATYSASGEQWDFTPDEHGQLREFSSARWAGYRAQSGVTTRRGDHRPVKVGWTWLEYFADRARDKGLVA